MSPSKHSECLRTDEGKLGKLYTTPSLDASLVTLGLLGSTYFQYVPAKGQTIWGSQNDS